MENQGKELSITVEHAGTLPEWKKIVDATASDNPVEKSKLDSFTVIAREHIRTMESSVQSAVGHLQTSMSWSQTVVAAGVSAMLSTGDTFLKAAALALSLVLTTSCSTRSAKNYINVIRFGVLQRRSLLFAAAQAVNAPNTHSQLQNWATGVRDYHLDWKSPVGRMTVIRKTLLEFHYIYMFMILIAFMVKLAIDHVCDATVLITLATGSLLAAAELIYFLYKSPYLARIAVDHDMKTQS